MKNTTRIVLFVSLVAAGSAASTAEFSLSEGTEVEQIQAAAMKEASKSLLKVAAPTLGKDNRAVVRVETSARGRSNYCLVLLNKLMVPGTGKGIWVTEKTECK